MSLAIESKYIRLLSHRLRNFKQKKDYLWNFSCPICGDSKKNLLKARGYVYAKSNNLFYRCHNCGASTSLGNFIKQFDAEIYKSFILERYKSGESGYSNFKEPKFDSIKSPKFGKVKRQDFEHAEWLSDLPDNHFCKVYAVKRKMPNKYFNKLLFTPDYKKFIQTLVPTNEMKLVPDARLVIPFYDENDELFAVSGRSLETNDKILRYVTIRTNENESKLIYGLDRVDFDDVVYIVEGPLDSLFLDNCIASGDANLSIIAKELVDVDKEDKVLIFDNEPRNAEVCKLMHNAIREGHHLVIWPQSIKEKDINEMIVSGYSQREIKSIISKNTFCCIRAFNQLVFWKKV